MRRLEIILTLGFLTALLSCGQNKSNNSENQAITKPVENITATNDQLERRARSEEYCRSKGIPVYKNPNALFVDSEAKVRIWYNGKVDRKRKGVCNCSATNGSTKG